MFKGIKLLYYYFSLVKKNKKLLHERLNLDTDYIYRLYTTITIPDNKADLLKSYGYSFIDEVAKSYIKECQDTFIEIGLHELVRLNDSIRLNDTQIGISFTYKYSNLPKLFNRLIFVLSLLVLGAGLFLILKNILFASIAIVVLTTLFFIIRKIVIKNVNLF
jgi:hypothetical protein